MGWNVYNGPGAALLASVKANWFKDPGNDVQNVMAGYIPKTPVAATALQSSFVVSSTTIALSSKAPGSGEEIAYVEAVAGAGDITYWFDGKDPAVTPGHVLPNGQGIIVDNIANFKMVRAAAADATAKVSYFKN